MINLKNILIIGAVSLLSLGTFALTKTITAGKATDVSKTEKAVSAEEADNEVITNDDPWKEMEKIVAGYYSKEGISYKGTTRLIDVSGEDEKVLEQMSFQYSLMGNEFYYKLGEFECISKENLLMAIDNQSRSITISRQNHAIDQKLLFNPDDFRKILEQKSGVVKVTMEGNDKIITVDSIQNSSIQGYRIHYDPISYRVKKLEIGMVRLSSLDEEASDEAKKSNNDSADDEIPTYTYLLEVNYDSIQLLSLTGEGFHPENKFIKIDQNNIQLTPAYNSYSLVDAGE